MFLPAGRNQQRRAQALMWGLRELFQSINTFDGVLACTCLALLANRRVQSIIDLYISQVSSFHPQKWPRLALIDDTNGLRLHRQEEFSACIRPHLFSFSRATGRARCIQ